MYDFFSIKTRIDKNKVTIFPEFNTETNSKDLMIRGGDFYAVWLEDQNIWSTNIQNVCTIVDREIYKVRDQMVEEYGSNNINTKLMKNFSSRMWLEFRKYCKNLGDNYHELNKSIIFANTDTKKTDYISKRLNYSIEPSQTANYDELISTLYSEEERRKIEWAIGAVISGDSKNIQKFMVFYGDPGSGKSTILNIIQQMFQGYCTSFSSKKLTSNSQFAVEDFRNNPLIAIDHDGSLGKIETNTKLNSIVSHEYMEINEKHKSAYSSKFDAFLFIATNEPVKVTDAKSGILRRLIDIYPTGNKIEFNHYNELVNNIQFELGGIAYHCLEVYTKMGPSYYNNYISSRMIGETNDFYNFIEDNYEFFAIENPDCVPLSVAWLRYKEYCEDARVPYPFSKRIFKAELRNYFDDFIERTNNLRNIYVGFKKDKFKYTPLVNPDDIPKKESWLKFNKTKSLFDDVFEDCPAQLCNDAGTPLTKWSECKTILKDIDTSKLHYIKVPKNLIVIDFDIKDKDGNKSYDLNYKAASRWPATYAELSKSGAGIHLHYIYDGDVDKLSRLYDTDIEIKVFKGNSSLRRQLTKCNDILIATINSGLPLKEEKVVTESIIKDEKHLRAKIIKALRKEVWPSTKPNMDYIAMVLDEAYNSGMKYDVSDMAPDIQVFALNSTHQSDYCVNLINKMHFTSDEGNESNNGKDNMPIIFFDIEVFPNVFILCWKKQGSDDVVKMVNPSPDDINSLIKYRLVGFNNRRYDNHIIYARMMGYNIEQLYHLSQRIINGDRNAFFGEAYNLSYTDIYDFLSAGNKISLKKWEIKLHIHHQENSYDWNLPLPEDKWEEVTGYCCNDVRATEAVWDANQEDWMAREILADLSGLSVNDTTNAHTTKIIVGNAKKPQEEFVYTDLSTIFPGYEYSPYGIDKSRYNEGEKIVSGKSIYKGIDPGEGGRVYSEPGMYTNVALLDIASMHPHSLIRLNLFGDRYTQRFKDLVDIRMLIKHKEFDKAKKLLDGKLAKYLDDPSQAKKLANALKTAINSVYGLTSARFENKLKDPRNIDNIVAKYGALFMINLQEEVQKRGFKVAHIKTDSIKIPDATPEIIQFVMNYGKEYGYTFEHEATYSKMCLVNESVYIAQYADTKEWTATGAQFQVPYVFKTLFSHEAITYDDICETKATTTSLYLDMNEHLGEDQHDYIFVGRVGSFVPVKPGNGGGVLLYKKGDQLVSVTGTKKKGKVPKDEEPFYRWLESESVNKETYTDILDDRYYRGLVDDAIETISEYGDFEWFRS